jgi:hypothetical protein
MGDAPPVCVLEEDQIAFLHLRLLHRRSLVDC